MSKKLCNNVLDFVSLALVWVVAIIAGVILFPHVPNVAGLAPLLGALVLFALPVGQVIALPNKSDQQGTARRVQVQQGDFELVA